MRESERPGIAGSFLRRFWWGGGRQWEGVLGGCGFSNQEKRGTAVSVSGEPGPDSGRFGSQRLQPG